MSEAKGTEATELFNMFEPNEFDNDVGLRNDIECDIVEECERVCEQRVPAYVFHICILKNPTNTYF